MRGNFIDLTGQRFGKLTVLYRTDDYITPKGRHCVKWHCKCDCGNECDKKTQFLKKEKCSCLNCAQSKIKKGFNDLATTNPELLKEWDYDKNGELIPTMISKGSVKKVWWKCSQGHSYQMRVSGKTYRHSHCPICSKEIRTSFSEQAIYYYIKKYFNDAENTNKNAIGMELDICIPSKRVAIEYDGFEWHQNNKNDNRKNLFCKAKNIKLIRIRESGLKPFDNCICIFQKGKKKKSLDNVIIELFKLIDNNLKVDIDVDRDSVEIYNLYIKKNKENNLLVKNFELAKEWNYEKNGSLKPAMFTTGSSKLVWWKCSKCGNEWMAAIYSRNAGYGCPICGYKKAGQKNSKKVAMVSFETNIILKTFNSIKEAVEKTGISRPTIISQCKGFRTSRTDFYWKYV